MLSAAPGRFVDAEAGLHYNRHRYYDPSIGRYVSADPAGQLGGFNVYRYSHNDPVNWIDPAGLAPFTNNSGRSIPFKPEHSREARLAADGETVDADAVYSPDGASDPVIIKIPNNASAEATPDGNLEVDAGLLGAIDDAIDLSPLDPIGDAIGVGPLEGRFLPREAELDGRERGFPNPYTGENWPFPLWGDPDQPAEANPCP